MSLAIHDPAAREILTTEEGERLVQLEAVVESGIRTFREVGAALLEIRDGGLFRSTHETFDQYCRDRWGLSSRHANRSIQAAEIAGSLGPIGPAPTHETQVRPLAGLPAAERADAWREASERSGGAPTERQVRAAVERRKPKPQAPAGQCLVDGELVQDTPEVAALRASGAIEPDATPEVLGAPVPEPEPEPAQLHPILGALTPEQWLETLPLWGRLQGLQKRTFKEDALAWLALQDAKAAFGEAFSVATAKVRAIGPWAWKIRAALRAPGPKSWALCETSDGGCGGAGQTLVGKCPGCYGAGYRVK